MPVSSRTRRLARAMLPDGGELQYLFPAVIPRFGPVFVAVTPRAILVLSTGWRPSRPRKVLAQLPRRTRLGPIDEHGIPSFVLDGIRYEVDDEYLAVVNAVDVEGAGRDALPPDPLPDL